MTLFLGENPEKPKNLRETSSRLSPTFKGWPDTAQENMATIICKALPGWPWGRKAPPPAPPPASALLGALPALLPLSLTLAVCWLLPAVAYFWLSWQQKKADDEVLVAVCELGEAGKACSGASAPTDVRGHVVLTQRGGVTKVAYEVRSSAAQP